jgi:hypothetical protein
VIPALRARAFRALLSRAIDYAGLFPPAGLSMPEAVANYAAYLGGEDAWALGRFIVPVARLEEFGAALATQRPKVRWQLSGLVGADMARDIAAARTFSQRHGDAALFDTLEFKAPTANSITEAVKRVGGHFVTFHEVSTAQDPGELLSVIAGAGARAKIRTGGVTTDAFPEPAVLARFLEQCAAARVPFKTTAGLHHPIRAAHLLTYEAASSTATFHGFANVFFAAAFAHAGWSAAQLVRVIEESSPVAFAFEEDGASWRGHRLGTEALQAARAKLLISFGSCSFEEPVSDCRALGWL